MPAHKNKITNFQNLSFWQSIWRLLIQFNFDLYPESFDLKRIKEKSSFQLNAQGGQAYQIDTSFKGCLSLSLQLWKNIQITSQNKCLAEWNYLGNIDEKDVYLSYLDKFFWQNQNQTDLLSRPDYPLLIAETFKISKLVEELGWDILSPLEKMSDKSRDFLLNLEQNLPEWSLNPFLINDDKGNFHWTILAKKQYLIQGSVYKIDANFIQSICFTKIS